MAAHLPDLGGETLDPGPVGRCRRRRRTATHVFQALRTEQTEMGSSLYFRVLSHFCGQSPICGSHHLFSHLSLSLVTVGEWRPPRTHASRLLGANWWLMRVCHRCCTRLLQLCCKRLAHSDASAGPGLAAREQQYVDKVKPSPCTGVPLLNRLQCK